MELATRPILSRLGIDIDKGHSIVDISFFIAIIVITIKVSIDLSTHVLKLIRIFIGFFKPLNYELDMTTKEYCKFLAEVDNRLKIQTKQECVTQINCNEQSGANSLDCATGLFDSAQAASQNPISQNVDQSTVRHDPQNSTSNHVYPNGWLPVMESSKVQSGQIRKAIILGRDIIVTRSSDGIVNVLDAYCPHMGVHIGVGGRVCEVSGESCVQCPFHGWTFRAIDGQCVNIPYLKNSPKCNIPKQARLKTWQCCEIDNFIYIWHHIDNQPPSWHLEPTPELTSGKFVLAGRSCHKTNLEMRDMHENGADMNHFEGIHNDLFVFGGEFVKVQAYNYLQKYTRHHWSPDWKPILNEIGKTTHMAEMNLDSWISFFKLRIFDIEVRATQIGPACVRLRYNSQWYGRGILKMNAVPLGGRRTLYVQHIYAEPSPFTWFMSKLVLLGEIMQLERDLSIWNHKKNITRPIFVPEDKIIKQFRLWYSQFYKRKCNIKIRDTPQTDDFEAKSKHSGF